MSFSVLMSVYIKEKPEYLSEALESVVNQSLVPGEIILMIDGPVTKELSTVIDEYSKKYNFLKVCKLKQNMKLGRSLAEGLQLCNFDIVARMDTDDISVPDRFKKEFNFLKQHPEISVVGGFIGEFRETLNQHKVKRMPVSIMEVKKYAKYRNPLNHMTVMFRKNAVLDAGNYRHFPFLEDYDLWCRMMAKGEKLANIPEILVYARTSKDLYARRGGYTYFKQYCKLRKNQRKLGQLNLFEYCWSLIITFSITMQPSFVRGWIYRILRRK